MIPKLYAYTINIINCRCRITVMNNFLELGRMIVVSIANHVNINFEKPYKKFATCKKNTTITCHYCSVSNPLYGNKSAYI